jgi:hypothetical protein
VPEIPSDQRITSGLLVIRPELGRAIPSRIKCDFPQLDFWSSLAFSKSPHRLPGGFRSSRSHKNTALLERLAVLKPFKAGCVLELEFIATFCSRSYHKPQPT